ncbi:ADP-ribosylation factor-like protein 2 [Gregarina niphandrodes]|uniref:ADP-ribosylation factor-like protein 2 n=1 Tax=Gregarina niphandrodes TaxID=110365 RepID=A0A023B8Z1_GRENI|nr:ADP-ribosylation factor-like protein 2 [Gregarina niphandrodes]EZG70494.1 ADP-ribosylation factor-like protein 2 [Gregarina niphandrodes]|eukprot:XP_011129945.1 ADP-ribosylation factor-like protein 2 [Gregarina niphandrodes]
MTSVALRLLVLGLDNGGKSTFVTRLFGEDIEKTRPTVGLVIRTKTHIVDDVIIDVDYWDVGGQESLRRHWHNIYHKGDAVVWVIDSSDVERMETCFDQLKLTAAAIRSKSLGFLVVCNKQDLPTALSVSDIRQVSTLAVAGRHRIPNVSGTTVFMEGCSAVLMSPDDLDQIIRKFIKTFLPSLPIMESRLVLPQTLYTNQALENGEKKIQAAIDWNRPIQLPEIDFRFTALEKLCQATHTTTS